MITAVQAHRRAVVEDVLQVRRQNVSVTLTRRRNVLRVRRIDGLLHLFVADPSQQFLGKTAHLMQHDRAHERRRECERHGFSIAGTLRPAIVKDSITSHHGPGRVEIRGKHRSEKDR